MADQTHPHCTPLASTPHSRRSFITGAFLALGATAFTWPALHAFANEGFLASSSTEAALASAQARYEEALNQIAYLNNQVFDAEAIYNNICAALDQTVQAIAELQATIEQRQAELAEAQDILAARLAANYRVGVAHMLDLILSAADFDDLVSRLYYAGKVSDADAEAIQAVKDIKAQLEADQAALREQQAEQERLQAEQAAQLEVLHEQVAQAEAYAASLDGEVQALIAQRNAEIAAAAEAARAAAEEEAARQAAAAESGGGYVDESTGGYVESGGGDYSGGGSSGNSGSSGGGSGYQPASVVGAGYNYIGTPYGVLDCSSFTSAAYGDCGYYITPQSGAQYSIVAGKGNLVGAGGLVAGNLVFYANSNGIYHVGIYIGGGMIIDSIPDGGVQVRDLYFCDGFCGGGSPL